jgi:hypothetical protein
MADLLSTAQSPWANPVAWDTLAIAGLSIYTKFEIKGASRKYRWNIADGLGFVGAYEVFQSQPPAKFSITFYFWADSQYTKWLQLVDALRYTPSHYPQPTNLSGGNVVGAAANLDDAIKANNASPSPLNSQNVLQAQAALKAAQANPTKTVSATNAQAIQIAHPQLQTNGITQVVVENIGALEKQTDDLLFAATIDFIEFIPQRPMAPQSPDTAASSEDPLLDPEIANLVKQGNRSAQNLSNTVSGMGQPNGMPK